MNDKERAAIIRAQKHRWHVSHVSRDLIMMEQAWIKRGKRYIIYIWPDGRVTSDGANYHRLRESLAKQTA